MYIGISPGFFHNITYIQPFFLQYIFDCFIPIPSSLATFFLPFCSKFHCRRKLLSPLPFISFPFFPSSCLDLFDAPQCFAWSNHGADREWRACIYTADSSSSTKSTHFFFFCFSFIHFVNLPPNLSMLAYSMLHSFPISSFLFFSSSNSGSLCSHLGAFRIHPSQSKCPLSFFLPYPLLLSTNKTKLLATVFFFYLGSHCNCFRCFCCHNLVLCNFIYFYWYFFFSNLPFGPLPIRGGWLFQRIVITWRGQERQRVLPNAGVAAQL